MAFSAITARGSNVSDASGTTLAVSPSAALTVGKVVFISCTTDNIQTTDGNTTLHSVSDTHGHTWNKVFEYTNSGAAAADGNTTSLWWAKITTEIGTGNSITLTTGSAVVDKIISIVEATIGSGNTLASTTGYTTTNETLTATLSGLTSREYLFFGLNGAEGEDTAKTPNTNYTERFDLVSSTSGLAAVNVQQHVQTRILTGTGDTCAVSGITYTDSTHSLTAFYEIVDTSTSPITGACTVAITFSEAALKGKAFLSNNTLVNGAFNDSTGWSISGESTISGGVGNIISTAGAYTNIYQSNKVQQGVTYYYEVDVVITTGGVTMILGDDVYVIFTTSGSKKGTIKSINPADTTFGLKRYTGVTSATVDNVVFVPSYINLSITGTLTNAVTAPSPITSSITTEVSTTSSTLKGKGSLNSAISTPVIVECQIQAKGSLSGSIEFGVTISGILPNRPAKPTITNIVTDKSPITAAPTIAITETSVIGGKGVMAGNIALVITVDADISEGAALPSPITGAATIAVTVDGSLKAKGSLLGTPTVAITTTSLIRGRRSISAAISISITEASILSGKTSLASTISVPVTVEGILRAKGLAASAILTSITTTAVLGGKARAISTINTAITTASTLVAKGTLIASIQSAISVLGSIVAKGTLLGAVNTAISTLSNIVGKGVVLGNLPVSISNTGSLISTGRLTGNISIAVSVTANLNGTAAPSQITGTITISITTTGSVIGKGVLSSAIDISMAVSGIMPNRPAKPTIIDVVPDKSAITGTSDISVSTSASVKATGNLSGNLSVSVNTAAEIRNGSIPVSQITGSISIAVTVASSIVGKSSISGSPNISITNAGILKGTGSVQGIVDSIILTTLSSLVAKGTLASTTTVAFTVAGELTEKLMPSPIVAEGTISIQVVGELKGKGILTGIPIITFEAISNIRAIGSTEGSGTLSFVGAAIIRNKTLIVFPPKLVYDPIEMGINLDPVAISEIFIDLDKKLAEMSIFIDKYEPQNISIDLEPRARSLEMRLQKQEIISMDVNM